MRYNRIFAVLPMATLIIGMASIQSAYADGRSYNEAEKQQCESQSGTYIQLSGGWYCIDKATGVPIKIPEPSAISGVMGLGILGIGLILKRKYKKEPVK
jgi:hypothetical protein